MLTRLITARLFLHFLLLLLWQINGYLILLEITIKFAWVGCWVVCEMLFVLNPATAKVEIVTILKMFDMINDYDTSYLKNKVAKYTLIILQALLLLAH